MTMPRINPVDPSTADAKTTELLNAVQKKMGKVPNLLSTMAQSTAVANAYLGFSQALSGGYLSAQLREQIALAVAETNGCDYCLAAHSAIGRGTGLAEDELQSARLGGSKDAKTSAALAFAIKVVENRGQLRDEDVSQLRELGYSEGEIGEIVANVAYNIFSNYFNLVAGTEVDFPAAPSLAAV